MRTLRTTAPKTIPRSERTVALSLGANAGDRRRQLSVAADGLCALLGTPRLAPLFRTSPVSELEQPDFLNTALVGTTSLLPAELLAVAKSLEWAAGRRRGPRFGPRPLDIDLLIHGELESDAPELRLPHPRLAERRFYLEPLCRVAPDMIVPSEGVTVATLLASGGAVGEVVEVTRSWHALC